MMWRCRIFGHDGPWWLDSQHQGHCRRCREPHPEWIKQCENAKALRAVMNRNVNCTDYYYEERKPVTRDPDRIEPMLDALREAWKDDPDQRLGQLIYNAARANGRTVPPCPELFYCEDDQMLKGLRAD